MRACTVPMSGAGWALRPRGRPGSARVSGRTDAGGCVGCVSARDGQREEHQGEESNQGGVAQTAHGAWTTPRLSGALQLPARAVVSKRAALRRRSGRTTEHCQEGAHHVQTSSSCVVRHRNKACEPVPPYHVVPGSGQPRVRRAALASTSSAASAGGGNRRSSVGAREARSPEDRWWEERHGVPQGGG